MTSKLEMTRRALLSVGAAAAGALAAPTLAMAAEPFFRARNLPIGVQLYTVGAQLQADLDGALQALAKIGYRTVELAGYAGHTPEQLRAGLDRAGLRCTSAHVAGRTLHPGPSLNDPTETLVAAARTMGFDTYVMPIFNIPERFDLTPQAGESLGALVGRIAAGMTADEWLANADYLNRKAAELAPHGIKLGYHNHNMEFVPVGSGTALDLLIQHTDPALVHFELDVGWAVAGGADPVALFRRYPQRFNAMHVKDVAATTKPNIQARQDPAEVGRGIIDWPRVMPAAYRAGVRRFFVEQEPPFDRPPLEAVKLSFDYLQALVPARGAEAAG